MKIRWLVFSLLIGLFIAVMSTSFIPPAAHAQTCYDVTGAPVPCPENPTKKPTLAPPGVTRIVNFTRPPTDTPTLVFVPMSTGLGGTLIPIQNTPTKSFTELPWWPTYVACWDSVYLTAVATLGVPNSGTAEYLADTSDCYPTETPTPIPTHNIIPVAGPVFLRPGVKNVLILVMIIGVLFTGGVLIARFVNKVKK